MMEKVKEDKTMTNLNFKAVRQMGATCVALQHLLSGDREIDDLHIFGATSFTDAYNAQISKAVREGHSSLFVTFRCDGSEALVDKLYFFKVSAKKKTLEMSFCSFVKSGDGKFALRLAGRQKPLETIYSRRSNRLVTRRVKDHNRTLAELNGLQALLAKAATPECQNHAFQVA